MKTRMDPRTRRIARWWLLRLWTVPVCAINIGINLGGRDEVAAIAWGTTLAAIVLSAIGEFSSFGSGFWRGFATMSSAIRSSEDAEGMARRITAVLDSHPRPWDEPPK